MVEEEVVGEVGSCDRDGGEIIRGCIGVCWKLLKQSEKTRQNVSLAYLYIVQHTRHGQGRQVEIHTETKFIVDIQLFSTYANETNPLQLAGINWTRTWPIPNTLDSSVSRTSHRYRRRSWVRIPFEASGYIQGFNCNSWSYLITAKISFTYIL